MTTYNEDEVPLPDNGDIDATTRMKRWVAALAIAVLVVAGAVSVLFVQNRDDETTKAQNSATQSDQEKLTLAQQVAAACAMKDSADDLGGLCAKADSIVQNGPSGPQGPEGGIGPQGPAGPQGPEGPLGPKGEQGIQGARGVQGPAGALGTKGEAGPVGESGTDGSTGPAGEPGATGPSGPPGPQGEPGATGPKGDTGDPGTSAYPFTFSFTIDQGPLQDKTYTCTLEEPGTPVTCTESPTPVTP